MCCKRIVLLLLFNIAIGNVIYAGNTGKIMGIVTDKETDEPLIGVNVLIKETTLGAGTDEDGYYFILQVPPGTYNIEFSYLGYHTITVANVKVNVDLTTEINAEMESTAIEATAIEVIAEEPVIQKDITSTRKTADGEELDETPGIETTDDVFRLFGGAVFDNSAQSLDLGSGNQLQVRDQSVKDVHIRGGRGGEILFMLDGMPVTHPLYGGRSVLELNVNDVEQIELLTGAFNAEYGQAQSGVVNITSRSGKSKFESGLEYRTDRIFDNSYNTQFLSAYIGGPDPFTGKLLPQLGLGLPGKFSFFLSTNTNLSNTFYNNHRDRQDISFLGINFQERQDNSLNLNAKLDWDNEKGIYTALSYHGSWKEWSRFEWLWRDYPNNMIDEERANHNLNFKFTHTLSPATFYNLNFGFLGVNYKASLNGVKPSEFWLFYPDSASYADGQGVDYDTWNREYENAAPFKVERTIEPPTINPSTGFFGRSGFENNWRDDATKTFTFRGDITSQFHAEHLAKAGIEVQYHDIRYIDIQDGGVALSPYGKFIYEDGVETPPPPGPFKEFGQYRWTFNAYPLMGGAYIQDKFEKSSLIINAGVRVDWFMPGSTVEDEDWKLQWEEATTQHAAWGKIQHAVSPRFGISFPFPLSAHTKLFFSYGHFNQIPELQFYYRDPYTGSFTGNPGLQFEKTILYEFGLTRQIGRDWAFDIKSYAKDISEQVGTTRVPGVQIGGLPVDLYDNVGYARARGLEFELTKKHSYFISGKMTYNIQWANGYSSSAFDDFIRSVNDFPKPIRERRLSWDVRHQIVFQATLSSPPGQHLNLFGFELPDKWDITVLSNFSSGKPYTPGTTDPVEVQTLENTATGPPNYNTDIKIKKYFNMSNIKFSLYLDIFNLFNQKNAQIEYGFNPWTGNPHVFKDVVEDTDRGYNWKEMEVLRDPRQFFQGRYAKLGIAINF